MAPATGAFTGSFELLDVTQKRTVKFSGVLRQDSDVQLRQQGESKYMMPKLKWAISTESLAGDIRFWRCQIEGESEGQLKLVGRIQ